MTEVELVYFRGLAFKYLPKEEQERIKRNIEVIKRLRGFVGEAYPHILNPYRAENDTEMAACFLLNDVKMAAAAREFKRGDEDLALFDEAVVESAMELAKVAEIALPVWVTKSQKSDAEALRQEVEALKAEVERLEAENLTAQDSPQKSALLLIARALELYQRGEPLRYTQERYVRKILEGQKGIHGLGKTTIDKLLPEAKKTIKEARNT